VGTAAKPIRAQPESARMRHKRVDSLKKFLTKFAMLTYAQETLNYS